MVSRETKLREFAELLLLANQRTNLVSRRLDLDAVLEIAEAFAETLDTLQIPASGKTLLDVGSGGGLPGIPLAIRHAHLAVVLNESRKLRVIELTGFRDDLGLSNVTILPGDIRADATVAGLTHAPQLITAFGVGKAAEMIPLLAPLLPRRGTLILSTPLQPTPEDIGRYHLAAAAQECSAQVHLEVLAGRRSLLTVTRA